MPRSLVQRGVRGGRGQNKVPFTPADDATILAHVGRWARAPTMASGGWGARPIRGLLPHPWHPGKNWESRGELCLNSLNSCQPAGPQRGQIQVDRRGAQPPRWSDRGAGHRL